MALGDFTEYDVENRSISDGGGAGGGRGGISDIGGGNLIPAPKNLTVKSVSNGAQFLLTFTSNDMIANSRNKAAWYRVYYLNINEVSVTNIVNAVPNPLAPPVPYPFQPGTQLSGKRHFVIDVPVSTGSIVTTTIPSGPFLTGGWFYASGVNSAGQEGGLITPPCPIPVALGYAAPLTEVTSQNATYTTSSLGGLKYATVTCTWVSNATTSIISGTLNIPTKYVQIFISNFANSGALVEGPTFTHSPVGGTTNTGIFTIETDRGDGGFPDPGDHTVTLYFVSLSASYSHRADPTSSPSKAIAHGFHV